MPRLQTHVRNTFLAGIFATIPIVVTVFVLWWVESKTRPAAHYVLSHLFHVDRDVPFLGIVLALAGIYLVGAITSSLLGKFVLKNVDRLLLRVPVLKQVYSGWKQVALTPGGTDGIFSKVALVPDAPGHTLVLAFTSGRPLEDNPDVLCVFVPNIPNPVAGQLRFVKRASCVLLDLTPEDAFKIILSTGNYAPAPLGAAATKLLETLVADKPPMR